MNDDIRAAVAARLEEKGMSRADLARAVGKAPQEISRALNGRKSGGHVPDLWASIFDALDVRLTLTPGTASGQRVEVPKGKPGRKPTKPGEEKTAGHTPEALAPAVAHPEAKHKDEDLDAAPLFDEAGRPAVGTPSPSPDVLTLAHRPDKVRPHHHSLLDVLEAGGTLRKAGPEWALCGPGGEEVRRVDVRTVAALRRQGVLKEGQA